MRRERNLKHHESVYFDFQPPQGRYFAINTKNIFLKRVFLFQKLFMKEDERGRNEELTGIKKNNNNAF